MPLLPLYWPRPQLAGLFLSLVLTACGGGSPPTPPDIMLSANTSSVTLEQGTQASLDLSITRMNGAVPVELVAQSLPAGVGLVFTKNAAEDRIMATLKVAMNVAPGAYPFQVVGSAGPVSKTLPLLLNVTRSADVTPPSAVLTVSPMQVSAPQTLILSADAKDDRGVARTEFFKNGVSIGAVIRAPWTLTTDITAADNGAPTFLARVTDTSGNIADSDPVKITVLIDRTNPVVTIDSGTSTDTPTYRLSGAATDDLGVQTLTYTLNDGQPVALTLSGRTYDADLTLLEGENRIVVQARDAAGHLGAASRTVTYLSPDTTPPTLSLTTDHPGIITAPAQVTLTADAHDNRAIRFVVFSGDAPTGLYQGQTVLTAPYAYTFDAFSLSNGVHTFRATAEDTAGLRTLTSVDVIVDIERTPPDVKITSKLYVEDGAYILTGTVTDASGIASVRLNNRSSQTDLGAVTLTGGTFSVLLILPVGDNAYTLTATDRTGNINRSDFQIQNIGPDVTVPDVQALWARENDVRYAGRVAMVGQAYDERQLGRFDLLRDGTVAESWDAPSRFASCTGDPNGIISCPFPFGPWPTSHTFWPTFSSADNGTHTFALRAIDAAGNAKDGPAQTLTINIDAANSVRPFPSAATGRIYNWNPSRASAVVWRFTDHGTGAQTSVGRATVDALGQFSLPLPGVGSLNPFLAVSTHGPECTATPTVSDPSARFAEATLGAETPALVIPLGLIGVAPSGSVRRGSYVYADRAVTISGSSSCSSGSWTDIALYDLTLKAGWNLVVKDDVPSPTGSRQSQKRVGLGDLDGLYWSY